MSFREDKISRFREFLESFAKINSGEHFGKFPFVKLNPREIHTNILSKTFKFEVADSKSSYECLILRRILVKYPTKPIFLHLKPFNLI